ncbi:hypothetical protein LSAT2_017292 [Lamellibrachia satsuma]|nr:hypothetical protein LSAT2_017292 [Lamellibrachia satsuma]
MVSVSLGNHWRVFLPATTVLESWPWIDGMKFHVAVNNSTVQQPPWPPFDDVDEDDDFYQLLVVSCRGARRLPATLGTNSYSEDVQCLVRSFYRRYDT